MFKKKEDLEKEIERVEGESISSIIDESMHITGEISFEGKTRVDGTITGNTRGDHLILSKSGKIEGDLEAHSFICHGHFKGNINARILTARKDCSITGKIAAASLTVEPGATIEGEIKAAPADMKQSGTAASKPENNTQDTLPPLTPQSTDDK